VSFLFGFLLPVERIPLLVGGPAMAAGGLVVAFAFAPRGMRRGIP